MNTYGKRKNVEYCEDFQLNNKRTKINSNQWVANHDFLQTSTPNPNQKRLRKTVNKSSPFVVRNRQGVNGKCKKQLNFDQFDINAPTKDEDILNKSVKEYYEMKSKSTLPFQHKHTIDWQHGRKRILNFCLDVLGEKSTYTENVHKNSPFLTGLLNTLPNQARFRYYQMLDQGFFQDGRTRGSKKPIRGRKNSIILSKQSGTILHILRLKNQMHDFQLTIETNKNLMSHLVKKDGKINHFSAKAVAVAA